MACPQPPMARLTQPGKVQYFFESTCKSLSSEERGSTPEAHQPLVFTRAPSTRLFQSDCRCSASGHWTGGQGRAAHGRTVLRDPTTLFQSSPTARHGSRKNCGSTPPKSISWRGLPPQQPSRVKVPFPLFRGGSSVKRKMRRKQTPGSKARAVYWGRIIPGRGSEITPNRGRPRQVQSLKATGEFQPSQGSEPLGHGAWRKPSRVYRTSPHQSLLEVWVLGLLLARQDSRAV